MENLSNISVIRDVLPATAFLFPRGWDKIF